MKDNIENKIKSAFKYQLDQREFDYRADLIKNKIKTQKIKKTSLFDIFTNLMVIKPQYALSMIIGIAIGFALNYQILTDMEIYDNIISAAIYDGEYYG